MAIAMADGAADDAKIGKEELLKIELWLFKNKVKMRVKMRADILEEWHVLWNEGEKVGYDNVDAIPNGAWKYV